MKYVVPINGYKEIKPLVDAGAGEVYCGLLEQKYADKYGNHDSISRRQGSANLSTKEELSNAVYEANEKEIPIYLTVNSRYSEPQLEYITDLCFEFEDMGGNGIQVSDIGLLCRLKGKTTLKKCLSILAAVDNIHTLKVFSELEINRVVLPRFVNPNEAKELLNSFERIESEVMAFFDKCRYIDGYCRYYHGVAYQDVEEDKTDTLEPKINKTIYSFDTTFKLHGCLRDNKWPILESPCAACHLYDYELSGVEYAKIGGRGLELEKRLKALEFLVEAEKLNNSTERKELYQKTFDKSCYCYYGDSIQSRDAIEAREVQLPENTYWLEYGESAPNDAERVFIGSETNRDELFKLFENKDWISELNVKATIVLPPLSQYHMKKYGELLIWMINNKRKETHLCLNDIGSYAIAANVAKFSEKPAYTPTIGSILAKGETDPKVKDFFKPEKNPDRIVWVHNGKEKEKAILKHKLPTPELTRHLISYSTDEPTAKDFLQSFLPHNQTVVLEF